VKRRVGITFWVEALLSSLTAGLAILTLVWHDRVEGIFGFDPDRHNGSFELELVVVCCLLAGAFASLARREWRRSGLTSAT
jgi:hypothetical protein